MSYAHAADHLEKTAGVWVAIAATLGAGTPECQREAEKMRVQLAEFREAAKRLRGEQTAGNGPPSLAHGAVRTDGRQPGRLPANRFHEAAWIVGDRHRIAPDVWIGAFCVIDAAHDDLTIGDGSVIAAGTHLYTHSTVRRTRGEGLLEHAPTKIGSRVSVCAGAIVLMGCDIGDGAVIGAGAVVRERTRVPAGETWAGVPARRIA